MKLLVTGTAGFIGHFVAINLLKKGHTVIGIDNVNDYYDVSLKEARLDNLKKFDNFIEVRIDMHDKKAMEDTFTTYKPNRVLNLAAQAGVRYSLYNPHSYIDSNITGFLNILEGCRSVGVEHLVFASTASVYGSSQKFPSQETDSCNHQLSLYAATKKSNEVMAHSYAHLFNIPCTGVRFFNVYGPWGRPDMALFMFAKNILEDKPIDVFNHGKMIRDFTYVEDIAEGVCKILLGEVPKIDTTWDFLSAHPNPSSSGVAPFRIYNIGNENPVPLMRYIELLEQELGKKAIINFLPIQPGEVEKSTADSSSLSKTYAYKPKVKVEEGIKAFVQWYKDFYAV